MAVFTDLVRWRWTPCVAIVTASLAYIGLAELLAATLGSPSGAAAEEHDGGVDEATGTWKGMPAERSSKLGATLGGRGPAGRRPMGSPAPGTDETPLPPSQPPAPVETTASPPMPPPTPLQEIPAARPTIAPPPPPPTPPSDDDGDEAVMPPGPAPLPTNQPGIVTRPIMRPFAAPIAAPPQPPAVVPGPNGAPGTPGEEGDDEEQ